MTSVDFLCLLPFILLSGGAVVVMLMIALVRDYRMVYAFSVLALLVTFLSLFLVIPVIPHRIGPLLSADGFGLILSGIILLATLAVALLSDRYLHYQESEKEEYFIILFIAALGSILLVSATSFITLFLGLETLSLSLYILIAYRRRRDQSIEAAVKYLVLASVSSAFLLFGMGLIYADTGTLEFSRMAGVPAVPGFSDPVLLAGFGMMMIGLGFKLALVPFHMWTPDVYQGAPVPVATLIATVSKGAVMAVLLRFFYSIHGFLSNGIVVVISVIAVLSMLAGNLLAIRQQNVKRILAYSSIANMGYLLVTLLIGNDSGPDAAVFYIISYIITTLGAFGVITLLSDKENDADNIEDYRGLFWKRPWVALVFTLSMLSLAGIPLTTGFMAKFYLVFAGIDANLWVLVGSIVLNSVLGLYYYLRIVTTMFSPAGDHDFPLIPAGGHLVLALLTAGILWLGIFPQSVFALIARFPLPG